MIKWILALSLLCAVISQAGDKTPAPGMCGITIGASRVAILEALKKSPVFSTAEITVDTNAIMVSAPKEGIILCDSVRVASVKCLFNKKTSLQGMNVVFPCQNGTDLEKAVTAVNKVLGAPKTASSDKIGFHYEAEWKNPPFEASFFASDQAFEAYLLLGYASFVKEEEDRSMKFEK